MLATARLLRQPVCRHVGMLAAAQRDLTTLPPTLAARSVEPIVDRCEAWVHPFLTVRQAPLGYISMSPEVFGLPHRGDLLQRVVVYQLAKKRAGTAKTKTRAEVRGGGRKPWKQKGTGRARASSIRSPLFRGGGVIHGPVPRDYTIKLNKKVKTLGLKVALSVKYAQGDLHVIDDAELETGKKRGLKQLVREHQWGRALIIPGAVVPPKLYNAASHAPQVVKALPQHCKYVNVLDILKYDSLVLTPDSIAYLEERLAPETWTGTSDIHWFDDEDFEASFIQELDEAYNELVQSEPHDEGETAAVGESTDPQDQHPKQPDQPRT